jgi:hypothetical protein
MVRDVAYAATLKKTRAELHERFAHWLEGFAGERAGEFEELVAYHLEQAYRYVCELGPPDLRAGELAIAAARRLRSAATRADARGDLHAQAALLRRAMSLLPELDPDRIQFGLRLVLVLEQIGGYAAAGDLHIQLTEQAGRIQDRRSLLRLRDFELWRNLVMGTSADAESELTEVSEISRDLLALALRDRNGLDIGRAFSSQALHSFIQGRFEAAATAQEQAMKHAHRAGALSEADAMFDWFAFALFHGPMTPAEALGRNSAVVDSRSARPVERASLLEVEALCAALSGNDGVARAAYGEAKQIFEQLGLEGKLLIYGYCGGMIERLGGNLEEAVREWTACGDALSEADDHLLSAYVHALRAGVLLDLGHVAAADEAVRRARSDSLRWDLVAEAAWRAADARVKAARGEPERGLARAREAVDRSAATDALILIGDAALAHAEVAAACERTDEAEKAIRKAVAAYAAKGCEPLHMRALDFAARLGIDSAAYSKQN